LLPATSRTFHGRDIFAPVAAHLARGGSFEDAGPRVPTDSLVDLAFPEPRVSAGALETAVVYVDSFGNLRLAGGIAELHAALGEVARGDWLELAPTIGEAALVERLRWAGTFGEVASGELLAYEDSAGNLAIAVSNGDASRRLGVGPDAAIRIRRA
jgi:S-adenosylmethionine hydrolase